MNRDGRFLTALFFIALSVNIGARAEAFAGYDEGFCLDTLALQVQLDRLNLSCNCVDGVWGKKTATALMTWQILNRMKPDGVPTGEILDQLGGTTNVLTHYIVTEDDLTSIAPVPELWAEKARCEVLGYESIQEMLAERGHTSMRAVERLNPDLPWPNPPVQSVVVLPNCHVREHLAVAASVRISLHRREITVFDYAGRLIALFPCSIARNRAQRPNGEIFVKNVAERPTYHYDPKLFDPHTTETTRLTIPPGPNNPVGLAWIGLTLPGYGIHGTPVPERIGEAASHGCFRLSNWNAKRLIQLIEIGTPVVVE